MERKDKQKLVDKLRESAKRANSIFLTEYKGINFVEFSELRRELKKKSCEIHVAKNTLMKIALKGLPHQGLSKFLDGPNSIVFVYGDGVDAAKILTEGAKKYPNLKLKAAYFDGQIYDGKGIEKLSKLPSRKELNTLLVRAISGPVGGFVRVLGGPLRAFVTVLSEIKKKKAA